MTEPQEMLTIGRRERIALPDLQSVGVEAKIDTGAFRTAVHCISARETERKGKKVLETKFDLDGQGEKTFYFKRYKLRVIKNSFGQSEERYCIRTTLRIGSKDIKSDVSLTDRSGMKFQVLIGRKTLGRKFLVDVSSVFLLSE